jgi:hypothetical protein
MRTTKRRSPKQLIGLALALVFSKLAGAHLTTGWTEVPFQFIIQSPYTLPMWDRYAYEPKTKTYTFSVHNSDSFHYPGSHASGPRTEMKIVGYNYRNIGGHQLEADFSVTPGTNATCIMQIKGGKGGNRDASATNTYLMLMIYGDDLCLHQRPIMRITRGKWYHLNVIHDAEHGPINVYIDGQLELSVVEHSVADEDHYFKVGVYNQHGAASVNEVRYRNIRFWEHYDDRKEMQSISFPPLPTSLPGGSTYDLDAHATSGLPITYLTSYDDVVSFVDGKLHVIHDGYADISATQPGDHRHNMATNVTQYLIATTPNKEMQTISCAQLPAKYVDDPDFNTGAVASSGSFLKVYSSNRAVATVTNNNLIHIEGAGTTTLTLLQIGTSTRNAAVIYRTLTVTSKQPPTAGRAP